MSNPDDNLPPQTSKFFDIIPASKRSASPTSRPLIVDNSPSQTDTMINSDQQPDLPEIPPMQPTVEEPVITEPKQVDDSLLGHEMADVPTDKKTSLPSEDPSPIQTDVGVTPEEENTPPAAETNIETVLEIHDPPPVQTDIEPATVLYQPTEDKLLLPANATPDQTSSPDAVVIHSPGNSKSFRLRTWLIALLFVIIIVIIGTLLYLFVFKPTATNTPAVQFFGS